MPHQWARPGWTPGVRLGESLAGHQWEPPPPRMTPPWGDNWAGAVGLTAGALVYFLRNGLVAVVRVMLVAGAFGGLGFVTATFLKLAEVKYVPLLLSHCFGEAAWQTNWHSLLEQTYGL